MVEEKKYLTLKDIESYNIAYNLSNEVWRIVNKWGYFEKDTVGKQLVRAMDSVSANIAEGFGRYGKNDKIRFYRIAYGSLLECVDWIDKALYRELISTEEYQNLKTELQRLPKSINSLVRYTNDKLTI